MKALTLLAVLAVHFAATLAGRAADSFRSAYLSEIQSNPEPGNGAKRPGVGWIEIANGSDAPVNLNGWFLTDNPDDLPKWRLPGIVVPPDKSIVVYASGRGQTTNLLELHASFQLNPAGGYLALVGRATNVVSTFEGGYPRLGPGTSYGRVRGEPSITVVFLKPTPGRANSSAGAGFAPSVRFSRAAGTFAEPFPLELAVEPDSMRGAAAPVLRYTLDGTMPGSASLVYTQALSITNTAHVRARAFQDGRSPGPPSSAVYLKLFTNVLEFSSTLPLLILDTFGQSLPGPGRTAVAHLSVYEPVNGRASLTNRPTLTTRVGYRVRGSTSADMPQSGFAVECIDEFNGERSVPLLGLPADSDWILYAPNAYDPVLIHNPFVHQLSRDLGRYSPRTRFVEMFVVTGPGRVRATHYHGLHVLEEKIKIGRNRVNIDRLEAGDVTPPAVTGGYLLKIDRLGPDEGGAYYVGDRPVVYVEPKEQTITLPQRAAQRRYLSEYLRSFEHALESPQWKDPAVGYPAYLDVAAAIDFHVVEVLSGNVDSLVLSTYWHKPREGRIVFGPHWDFDRALGSTDGRDEDPRNWSTGPFFNAPWWDRLFTDVDFWQRWVDRWQELRRTHFATTNLNRLADHLAEQIRDAQPRQYQRWDFRPRGGSYASELAHMKEWLSSRTEYIDGQLVAPPEARPAAESNVVGSAAGASIAGNWRWELQAPTNVTIYYTLDGSDPRLPQGGISSNAVPYSAPVELPIGAKLVARARNPAQRQRGGPPRSTPWSSPVRVSRPE